MKNNLLVLLLFLMAFSVFGQSFNRSITKVNIDGTDYTSFPINHLADDDNLSITVFFTYQKTDNYNHSYNAGGKFFINNSTVNAFSVPNLDNNQPWNSSVSSLIVPINNINSLALRVRITTQAPDSPNPSLRDYDTQTIIINVQKPVTNNTISATSYIYNYPVTSSITLTGSQPIGGNGNYTYRWFRKEWHKTQYSLINGATGKNYTIPNNQINTHTAFIREVYDNGVFASQSASKIIKVKHPTIYNSICCVGNPRYVTPGTSFQIGDDALEDIFIPSILGVSEEAQQAIFSFQWQKKIENGAWINISGATSRGYTFEPIYGNDQIYYRRLISSDHLINSPNYSNIVSFKASAAPPISNNTITFHSNGEDILGSQPNGGEDGNYHYMWGFDCALNPGGGFSTNIGPTHITQMYSSNHSLKDWDNYLEDISYWFTYVEPKTCEHGYMIRRFVSASPNYYSYSNLVTYSFTPKANYNIQVLSRNSNEIIFDFSEYKDQDIEIYLGEINSGKIEKILNFKIENNSFRKSWIFPTIYQKGVYSYKIISKGQIIKTGNIYNK